MGYTPTEWLRRISQFPDRYGLTDLGGGLFTITPSEGDVTQEGTPLTENALNHLETQYAEAIAALTGNNILERLQEHLGVWWFNNHWLPTGMMSTGVSASGIVGYSDVNLILNTQTTSDSHAYAAKDARGLSEAYSWDKKRYLGCYVCLETYTAQNIHIVTGGITNYKASGNSHRHVGFKLIDNVLYGTVADGTNESTLNIETITSTAYRRLEVVFTPASEARFYANGVDKGAITTNLPSGTTEAGRMLHASVHNTEAVYKRIFIYESRTFQEEG